MLVESLRETAREIARSTGRKVGRVLVGRSIMDSVVLDVRVRKVPAETARHTGGMRVVSVAGLEIREKPWELSCDVRFEVEA